MDYKAFFDDVVNWINQVNQAAAKYGMDSQDFWEWVVASAGTLCTKYQNNRLAIKQMIMMVEWLNEVNEGRKAKSKQGTG